MKYQYAIDDFVGKTFGKWIVLALSDQRGKNIYFLCKCQCGEKKAVRGFDLRTGIAQCCGRGSCRVDFKHGMTGTPMYRVWASMLARCRNATNPAYKNYGERGIKVCERWLEFKNFFEDMGEAPRGLTLERIDNNNGYSKENCRWASRKEQGRNNRQNRMITFRGKTQCLSAWVENFGINYDRTKRRLHLGWSFEEAILN